jgi:antitoxin component of MazEF toxin-antitoxin module
MTATLKKVGGSLAVFIPKAMAEETDLVEGSVVNLCSSTGSIVIRKSKTARRRRRISQIVSEIKPNSYRRRRGEFSSQAVVGKEIW